MKFLTFFTYGLQHIIVKFLLWWGRWMYRHFEISTSDYRYWHDARANYIQAKLNRCAHAGTLEYSQYRDMCQWYGLTPRF